MPQPISKKIPNPHVFLDTNILRDKPDFAILVCQIFAVWARIEQDLSFILVRVLGANATPSIAMYEILTSQTLQIMALEAAAKAALSPEDFAVFKAAISVANSVQTPRNHLAHWSWGGCKQLPDIITLADPKMLNKRDFNVAKHTQSADNLNTLEWGYLHTFNNDGILAYTKADLERSLRDLREAEQMFAYLHSYLDTKMAAHFMRIVEKIDATSEQIKSAMLEKLNSLRLFREALARIMNADQKTPPEPQNETPA